MEELDAATRVVRPPPARRGQAASELDDVRDRLELAFWIKHEKLALDERNLALRRDERIERQAEIRGWLKLAGQAFVLLMLSALFLVACFEGPDHTAELMRMVVAAAFP